MAHRLAALATRRQLTSGLIAAVASAEFAAEARKKRQRKKRKHKKKHGHGKTGGGSIGMPAHVALGAFVPNALYDDKAYNDFKKAIGRTPDYLVWYEDWASGNFNDTHRSELQKIDERGLTAVIDWEPHDADGPTIDQPAFRLSTISGGDHNGYIDSWARGLAEYGKPVYMKFAHEMNGGWFPWGAGVNGNQKGDFSDAWRYLRDRFDQRGAANVRWVWVPNKVYDTIPATFAEVYPGDDYVDWIGMNGYNWGTSVYWVSCPCRSKWETFADVFDETYRELVDFSDKPIMVGEAASSEKGGDKARWISNGLISQLPSRYPQVRAFTWFHARRTGLDTNKNGDVVPTASVDWRITSSDTSRKAFRQAVTQEFYRASLRSIL